MEAPNRTTDLFERYLQAVRKYLPSRGQDDIISELRANLDAQREEREASLGRALTEGEMIDWLKELGPPMQMAARYQPPRYLIGPAIFPLYTQILRYVLLWASVVYVIVNVAQALVQQQDASWIARAVFSLPATLMITATIVTLLFVVLEYVSVRNPEKCPDFMAVASRWSPTSLPPLEKEPPAGSRPRTFATALAEFVAEFALLLWVLLIPHYPFLLLGPGVVFLHATPIRFAPAMVHFYWAIVIFGAIQFIWHGYELLTNRWRIRGPVQKLVTKGLGIVPISILLAAPGHICLLLNPASSGHLPDDINLAATNHGIYTAVVLITLISVVQFLWELRKTMSRARRQPSAVLL